MKKRVNILGVPIDHVTKQGAIERIETMIQARLPSQVATVNPEFIMAALRQPTFRTVLRSAELTVPDGAGIRGAATFLSLQRPQWQPAAVITGLMQGLYVGICLLFQLPPVRTPLSETVTGIDLIESISRRAAQKGWRLYLVGEDPGVAEAAATVLQERYPSLQIAGAEEGLRKGTTPDANTISALVDRIAAARPDVLLVAFGAPKQDIFIAEHKQALGVPVMIGVGGSFNFITGRAKRSPAWLQQVGLEWLWRVIYEPWRVPRIITATIKFPWQVYRSTIDQ